MRPILAGAVVLLLAASAGAAPDGWLASLDGGLDAARRSGKPVLVVTAWKSGI